jgi:hypothetical protein
MPSIVADFLGSDVGPVIERKCNKLTSKILNTHSQCDNHNNNVMNDQYNIIFDPKTVPLAG